MTDSQNRNYCKPNILSYYKISTFCSVTIKQKRLIKLSTDVWFKNEWFLCRYTLAAESRPIIQYT